MNKDFLKQQWLAKEKIAHIHGWDFSHILGRYEEENDLPWDYEELVRKYLKPEHVLLDLDTGGGEFLLSLHHPFGKTSATEAYPPNVLLCQETIKPLGIDFREANAGATLPFSSNSFDVIINRHGDFNVAEVYRVRKINSPDLEVDLVSASADSLPFNDESFDTVVSTFTLSSVQHLEKVLAEIFRVLKPDGQFIFLEHRKSKNKLIIILQNVFNPIYNRFAYGCNINRKYQKQLIDCGFSLLTFNIEKAPIYPRLLTGYIYWGVAKKQLNKEEQYG